MKEIDRRRFTRRSIESRRRTRARASADDADAARRSPSRRARRLDREGPGSRRHFWTAPPTPPGLALLVAARSSRLRLALDLIPALGAPACGGRSS